MIGIIAFFIVCLIWQTIKDEARGGRDKRHGPPTVRVGAIHTVAKCGCDTAQEKNQPPKVIRPCAAHRLIVEALRNENNS